MMIRKIRPPVPAPAGDDVAKLLANLALDRQRRHGHAEQPKPEERRRWGEIGAQDRVQVLAVGATAADQERGRATDGGRGQ